MQKDGEVALFGGEYFDSAADRQLVYGDLFVFNCSKERWRKVVIPNRCCWVAAVAECIISRKLFLHLPMCQQLTRRRGS